MSEQFALEDWYASEPAKRSFGRICQAANEEGASVKLLGTEDQPLLLLEDADLHPPEPSDVEITIDEAKADWSAVTTAAAVYGTRFRIKGRKKIRAVLSRYPSARHPAERYLRSSSPDVNHLAQQLETLAREVRKLGQKLARNFARCATSDLIEIADRLAQSADLIDRRFQELWRGSNGYVRVSPS